MKDDERQKRVVFVVCAVRLLRSKTGTARHSIRVAQQRVEPGLSSYLVYSLKVGSLGSALGDSEATRYSEGRLSYEKTFKSNACLLDGQEIGNDTFRSAPGTTTLKPGIPLLADRLPTYFGNTLFQQYEAKPLKNKTKYTSYNSHRC
jgi:hypothetical protein